ncbi:class I SAM-dependent methyltransferase [Candidatus Nomurabacteria bacterium]|nr:class I SAM-dependent methyltransferase [Candidatus Nomurabacteria bacterium]
MKELPEHSKVLDAGCGKGRDLKFIKKECPHINFYAVDFENHNLPKDIVFKEGDVKDIPNIFLEEKFDVIISQHVLEHILYPVDIVRGFKTVLKKEGRIFIESPNWTRLFVPFHNVFFWNDPSHIRPFTKSSYKNLCSESGLEAIKIFTKSSSGFSGSFRTLLKSNNPFVFIKRFIGFFINPILFDTIILIAKHK